MNKLNIGRDLYIKGRIGWRGLNKDEYLKKSEYKIINATALMDGYVDWNNCGYISKERYEESEEIMLKEGDILISKDGTLGKIGYVKDLKGYCTVASGIFVLRNTISDVLDFDYLYHVLKSNIFKNFINRNKSLGSTINHLYQRDLENFELDLPPMETQHKIAKILNDFDEKLDKNNRINNYLEDLMMTIYQRWFIEYEFPDNSDKSYKSNNGKLKYNTELKREIPINWNVKKFIDIANMYQPRTIPMNELNDYGIYNVYGANGIIGKYDKYNHEENEIAICCRGAGCGEYVMTLPFSWITGNAMVIKPKEDNRLKEYIYYKLSDKDIYNYVTGSAQPQITRTNIENMKILIPDNNILQKFDNIAIDIRKQKINLLQENERLESLKNMLLPMLMNGQINVDDIEI